MFPLGEDTEEMAAERPPLSPPRGEVYLEIEVEIIAKGKKNKRAVRLIALL